MKGLWNNYLLENSNFLDNARTQDRYSMFIINNIPFVNTTNKVCEIKGELYNVSKSVLKHRLDVLEGYPTLYNRQKVNIIDSKGLVHTKVWMYVINNRTSSTLEFSGSFKHYINESKKKRILP